MSLFMFVISVLRRLQDVYSIKPSCLGLLTDYVSQL